MQFLKMTWMIMWRMWLFAIFFAAENSFLTIFLISVIIAAILRYGAKISIRTFPIIRLLGRGNVVDHYGDSKPSATPAGSTAPNAPINRKIVDRASGKGRMTGFEPYHLDNIAIPSTPFMRGVPGVGLSSAAHMSNYSIKTGQMGETNFAKALSVLNLDNSRDYSGNSTGILDHINSFWSIAMPSEMSSHKADKVFNTDIDCVIVSGNNIFLIDTKFYSSGNVTYTSNGNQLYCIDNSTGNMVKQPREMTRNMAMAMDRFAKHYPKMNVQAYVVLMPTNSGSANISNVFWPGNIPAVTVDQMTEIVRNAAATSGTKVLDHRTISDLISLQKD